MATLNFSRRSQSRQMRRQTLLAHDASPSRLPAATAKTNACPCKTVVGGQAAVAPCKKNVNRSSDKIDGCPTSPTPCEALPGQVARTRQLDSADYLPCTVRLPRSESVVSCPRARGCLSSHLSALPPSHQDWWRPARHSRPTRHEGAGMRYSPLHARP